MMIPRRPVPQQVETKPIDQATALSLQNAERAFGLDLANISRAALAVNGLDPADGWVLNLRPGTVGYRQFTRLKANAEETAALPEATDSQRAALPGEPDASA